MYKVFINDRVIELTDNYDDYKSDYDTIFIRYGSEEALDETINLLRNSTVVKSVVIYCEDLEKSWDLFSNKFKLVEAAGGIIKNKDRILFIYKNDHWDLPKGKIESNESIENTALREVKEECGIGELAIVDDLESTYYIYRENGDDVLKKTSWFLMTTPEEGPFNGDSDEGISEVEWMNSSQWESENNKSYASVRNLLSSLFHG